MVVPSALSQKTAPAPVLTGGTIATSAPVTTTEVAHLELTPDPVSVSSSLPDAPSAVAAEASAPAAEPSLDERDAGHKYPKEAGASDVTVLAGQIAPKQTVRDKMVGSVRDAVSPWSVVGYVLSGSYTHLVDGSPNFGPGISSYGQRVGSAAARGASQNIFYEGAMASILHEDPRYYVMGSGHPFYKRILYAGSRPLITRTDGGRSTPNLALWSGYLGAAALTKTYYPPLNQGFNQTLQTFGGSIGGAAVGFLASEFLSDALQLAHLKKGG